MVEQIKLLFAVNDVIVQFIHGQVFLILGVTMALQWRQPSQLELARALPWLAGVGLLEAIATWGNSFIPVQAAIFSAGVIQDLRFMQVLVYLATFMTLLGFGLKLIEPAVSPRVTLYVPLAGFVGLSAILIVQQIIAPGDATRNAVVEALLRYFLCIPAALLVAYGLRQQATRLVGSLKIERIIGALRIAGVGFLLYALVEGLLVPPLNVFPANWVNSQTIYNAIGVPVGILRAIVGTLITVFFLRAMEVFRIEADRLAQALEREQSLGAERERISRDLHDGTIQSIYAAGLVLDGVRQSIDGVAASQHLSEPDSEMLGQARVQLDQVMTALNKTIQGIRSYIYDLRASTADEDMARGLVQIVGEFRNRTGLQTRWHTDGTPTLKLTGEKRQQVYQIVREALSNIARHAGATQVSVDLRYDGCDGGERAICLRISDNGTGKVPAQGQVGRGLRNMRERAQLLGATLDVEGSVGKGTVVTLVIRDVENQITAGR
jgi:signal transduction histidine kinase